MMHIQLLSHQFQTDPIHSEVCNPTLNSKTDNHGLVIKFYNLKYNKNSFIVSLQIYKANLLIINVHIPNTIISNP